jgi:hypothetical protein
MPWKVRKGGRYYYRSVREGGRVRTEYVGTGPEAEAAELIDRFETLDRERAAEVWRERRRAAEAEDLAAVLAFDRVEVVARLALESAGFRRHKRGEWRRSRMGDLPKGPDAAGASAKRGTRSELSEFMDLLTRASKGDESAMPVLRELFRADPARMIKASGSDLAWQAEQSTIKRLAGKNLAFEHGLGEKLQALRAELAGPDAPAVERLLAERVALCYLDVHSWEMYHNQAMQGTDGLSFRQADHFQRMRDRSHRRYLQALKTLATVRKLGLVAIQVNIQDQQINLGGG